MEIEFIASPAPKVVHVFTLILPASCTLAQARAQALGQLQAQMPGWDDCLAAQWTWGIWGRRQPDEYQLTAQDRLEAWRPLKVDPKVARRERFARQGSRGAGLFAKRRKNAKPGY